jgi:hypothetical protein
MYAFIIRLVRSTRKRKVTQKKVRRILQDARIPPCFDQANFFLLYYNPAGPKEGREKNKVR